MKALWFDRVLSLREVERPQAAPGEALIQVSVAGICGTDLEILKGYSRFRGILGHEFVGRVVECEQEEWVGKRVVGEINLACGRCNWCLAGMGRHCPARTVMGIVKRPGCFAEYVGLPVRNLHEVPEELPDQVAVFVEPVAAAAEVLEQTRIAPGTPVAVLGDGRLGLLIGQVLRHARNEVTLVGRHSWKLGLARLWGLETFSVDELEYVPRRFPVVVEATGSPDGLALAFNLVEPCGVIVMKSTFPERASFDTARLVVDEITLLGSRCGDFRTALELLRRGHVAVAEMVNKVFPLEEGLPAFEFAQQASCLKVLLRVSQP